MAALILDCSVAVSWLLPDENHDRAILDFVVEKGALVPTLWFLEVGNVLLMAERRKRITAEQRQEALHLIQQLPIAGDDKAQLSWQRIMDLAVQNNLTVYDATYLELSQRMMLPLATYDKGLRQAAKSTGVTLF